MDMTGHSRIRKLCGQHILLFLCTGHCRLQVDPPFLAPAVRTGQLSGLCADRDHHMAVAFFSRRGPGCEADGLRSVPVNCIFAKPLDSAFSALGADLDLLEIFSGLELFLCVLRVSTCHHIFPDVLHICAALLRPVVVKSSPHTACKGRRISYEPGISDICRRPALTG